MHYNTPVMAQHMRIPPSQVVAPGPDATALLWLPFLTLKQIFKTSGPAGNRVLLECLRCISCTFRLLQIT